ncbi:MAG: S8 family peptidase [Burkholderiales bacterium]|nr:S8 family peptidase [Burkholderiales bacterium]
MHSTRKHFAIGFIAAALFSSMNPASSQTLARGEPQAAGLIIKFRDGSRTPVAAKAALQGFRAMSEARGQRVAFDRESAFGRRVIRLARHVPSRELAQLARDIQASDASIESVEIDHVVHTTFTPNDASWASQWDMSDPTGGINAPKAWDVSTGFGVRVAVLDTGVRPHTDLLPNLLPGYDFITDSDRAGDGGGRDGDASDPGDGVAAGDCGWFEPAKNSVWHGTHVAGTIAAVGNNAAGISGVAPKAKIVPVRVLGKCGGAESDIADGIVWAVGGKVANVPINANPAQILNLSLGGEHGCSSSYQDAINLARSKGALVVVSAGNDNQDVSAQAPANCKGVMAVAATNKLGAKADYSNHGAGVDIAAPGGDSANGAVLSLYNSGTMGPGSDSLWRLQGTSMAAPHVAGVAALMMASNSFLQGSDTAYLMKSTARAFPGSCSGCGNGIVDAEQAVLAARGFRVEKEPNDTLATAQYINVFPARVLGTLQAAYPEKVDVFSINLPASTTLNTQLNVLAFDFYFSATMELLDVNGKVIRNAAQVAGKTEVNYYNNTGKAMVVYLRVKGSSAQMLSSGDRPYEVQMRKQAY